MNMHLSRFHHQNQMIWQFLSDSMDIVGDVSKAIVKASTNLSDDKYRALKRAVENEDNDNAVWALDLILKNYKVAMKNRFPLCDDTGIPHIIIELGSNRQITQELLNQVYEGIEDGLNNLPARPMAVLGDEVQRIEQSRGLHEKPGLLRPAPVLIDTSLDNSSYSRDISEDALNIHILLQGGGPEIRSKTLKVYHKRSFENVKSVLVDWFSTSLKMLGCTPSIAAVGIGRTHFEATSLLLKGIVYGSLDCQSKLENDITDSLNELGIGPMGFGGKTTVLGTYLNIGNQRASGVRIVSTRPLCFVEPRVETLKL